MKNFEDAVNYIFTVEGGFVNHSNDRGGATKYGITIGALARHRKKQVSIEDIKKLEKTEAKEIYRLNYWSAIRLGEIKDKMVSHILFDQAVHSGPNQSAMMIQYVISESFDHRLKVDGIIGQKTLEAINAIENNKFLVLELIRYIQIRYIRICEKNPSQYLFLKGWINRSHKLLKQVFSAA